MTAEYMTHMSYALRREIAEAAEDGKALVTREALRLACDKHASAYARSLKDVGAFISEHPEVLEQPARRFTEDRTPSFGWAARVQIGRFVAQNCDEIVATLHEAQYEGRRWEMMERVADLSLRLLENRPDLAGDYPVENARDRLGTLELSDWPDRDSMTGLLKGLAWRLELILRESGEDPLLTDDEIPTTSDLFNVVWDMIELDERDHGAFYAALREEWSSRNSAPAPL